MTINGVKNVLKANINKLDDYNSHSLKAEYYKLSIKQKTQKVLERIKKIKGASVLLPQKNNPEEVIDVEKFGLTLKTMIIEEDPELASFLNIHTDDILLTPEYSSVIAFALSPNDFKEVICAMKYMYRSYQKEGFLCSATNNQNITESLIQQSAHIVRIEK